MRPSRLVVAACMPFIMNACSSGEAKTVNAQTTDSTAKPNAEEKPAVADVTKPALTLDTANT